MIPVAVGLRAVLGRVLGKATAARTLTKLTGAQRAYSSSVKAFKKNPTDAPKPQIRSDKARQEDAVELGKMFLNYLRESVKGAKFNHTAKSAFTKKLQQARGNAQKPLWFTGELWEDRKRGDVLVEKYTEIRRTSGGVIVGFRTEKKYVTPSNAYSADKKGFRAREGKPITVGNLLRLLEKGKRIKVTLKMAWWIIAFTRQFYTKKERADFLKKRREKKGSNKDLGYIILPARPFWTRAVNAFKKRMKGRTNVQIESGEQYKLKILVKN